MISFSTTWGMGRIGATSMNSAKMISIENGMVSKNLNMGISRDLIPRINSAPAVACTLARLRFERVLDTTGNAPGVPLIQGFWLQLAFGSNCAILMTQALTRRVFQLREE
jgi:hypothetical protein